MSMELYYEQKENHKDWHGGKKQHSIYMAYMPKYIYFRAAGTIITGQGAEGGEIRGNSSHTQRILRALLMGLDLILLGVD